jgi:alpha-D-xyloside xylohydrolase
MRFNDGYWSLLPGMTELRPRGDGEIEAGDRSLTVYAPTGPIRHRGSTLNHAIVTVTLSSPAEGVVGVTIAHHLGGPPAAPAFELARGEGHEVGVSVTDGEARLVTGDLTARLVRGGPWLLEFLHAGRVVTASTTRSVGIVTDRSGPGTGPCDPGRRFVHERLRLGVGETVYGLGERFGAFAKNGQTVDVWNADGGTASEQAYKNVPFYLSSAGYGVFVAHPERVSFELGSEVVSQAQFSVEGESLTYYVIDGPTPKDVLRRYTALTGRPARVPAWSYGLWLSTSFTTSYDEETVTGFVDGMAERGIPLSVFHFDCFWMRAFHWCDFVWDPATFPDPAGMLARLKARGLRISLWINPYIAQRSHLFEEGRRAGYLVRRPDGSVWQWDRWQAGMGLVDFTNPDAVRWFVSRLETLLDLGVDCFKTDFGERVPTDVVWADGSDPRRMHNHYSYLYNQAVFDLLERRHGRGSAVVFARSATAGCQRFPVHWGGDCESTYEAMAESLRGGLSLSASGFGFWSHDIGGFEGSPDPVMFMRWAAFGLLSSHSRLHGSSSVRVPWAFGDRAVEVVRRFVRLKMSLMPYLAAAAEEAHLRGVPVMRPMVVEFPDDPATAHLDRQYMLGGDLLVAPVMSADGEVTFYVPAGTWTDVLSGERLTGPSWIRRVYPVDGLPLLARPGAVIPFGAVEDRPDYAWADGVELRGYGLAPDQLSTVEIPSPDGGEATRFEVEVVGGRMQARLVAGTSTGFRCAPG